MPGTISPKIRRPSISRHNKVGLENIDSTHNTLPFQGHYLANTKLARPDHGAVYAGVVFVQTNHRSHHVRISRGCVWIKINHDTALIPHRNPDSGAAVPFPKYQGPAYPSVFLKRRSAICFDHHIWPKSSQVKVTARFALDATPGVKADYRNRGLVKDAMLEIHQFDITAMPVRNLLA